MTDPIIAALKAERKRQGLSQQQVGEQLGRRTYQTVWQWENGARSPRLDCLRQWAEALGFELTVQPRPRPRIVCLCGSTRFSEAFREANLRETVAGRIVLSIGCNLRSDHELWPDEGERERLKVELDELHKRKIDLADEVLVLNVGGYVGTSTRSEIEYAQAHGKPIRYLESGGTRMRDQHGQGRRSKPRRRRQ